MVWQVGWEKVGSSGVSVPKCTRQPVGASQMQNEYTRGITRRCSYASVKYLEGEYTRKQLREWVVLVGLFQGEPVWGRRASSEEGRTWGTACVGMFESPPDPWGGRPMQHRPRHSGLPGPSLSAQADVMIHTTLPVSSHLSPTRDHPSPARDCVSRAIERTVTGGPWRPGNVRTRARECGFDGMRDYDAQQQRQRQQQSNRWLDDLNGRATPPTSDRKRCTKEATWCSSNVPLAANGTGILIRLPTSKRLEMRAVARSCRITD